MRDQFTTVDDRHPLHEGSQEHRQVLVIDDDPVVTEMLALVLVREGFTTRWCSDGDQALTVFRDTRPDVVLLDVTLPGRDGLTICRDIRAISPVPILMVTASCTTDEVVAGLDAGANDYITKPFKRPELLARIRARLRRTATVQPIVQVGDLIIDIDGHTVTRNNRPLMLTPLEFDLLVVLAKRRGQVLSREQLLQDVWGYSGSGVNERIINTHIQRLRAKIERDPHHPKVIESVRGIGYRA